MWGTSLCCCTEEVGILLQNPGQQSEGSRGRTISMEEMHLQVFLPNGLCKVCAAFQNAEHKSLSLIQSTAH